MKSNEENFLSDEALEALTQEGCLSAMGYLREEYQNMPVPEQAKDAIQKGIQRAKEEVEYQVIPVEVKRQKRSGRLYGGVAAFATLAATVFLFVLFQTNTQLAVSVAEIPILKPVVEWITGQEYHEDVYLDVKIAHLAGQVSSGKNAMPVPLAELFEADADYIAILSAEIREQIAQSEQYDTLQPVFITITSNQNYYINTDGCLVIVLDEYETAPEFLIDTNVIAPILKNEIVKQ